MSDQNVVKKGLSLADLDLSKQSDVPFEFEYLRGGTDSTGFFISVIGRESDKSKEWSRKALNRMRQKESVLAKKGKDYVREVEEDEEFSIQMAANRIIGWRGIPEPYSNENALFIVSHNSEIREQVIKQSEELGNFTTSK